MILKGEMLATHPLTCVKMPQIRKMKHLKSNLSNLSKLFQ